MWSPITTTRSTMLITAGRYNTDEDMYATTIKTPRAQYLDYAPSPGVGWWGWGYFPMCMDGGVWRRVQFRTY